MKLLWKIGWAVPILLLTLGQVFGQNPGTSVEIDLEEQTAYLLQNGRPVLATPISSGRYGHLTKNGSFKVLEKERTHYSSMYGKIVDARGNTIVADADAEIVRGEIAILQKLYSGQHAQDVLNFDVDAFFTRIGLEHFLTNQRRTGLASMVNRIRTQARSIVTRATVAKLL